MGQSKRVGLIAGWGRLPVEVLNEIKMRRETPVVFAIRGEADPQLAGLTDEFYEISAVQMNRSLAVIQQSRIDEVIFAGKVRKQALFGGELDEGFRRLISSLPQKNDDAIMTAIVNAFESFGLTVAKQTDYLQSLLAETGLKTADLSPVEESDLQLGFRMAKVIGDLDIGQSIVVKQGVVLAVEAIEGTDQAILRGGALGGPGSAVVKVSKPKQDLRFDVPTVGRTTLESMAEAKASVLGVETGKTIISDRECFFSLAQQYGIKVVGI